MVTSLEQLFKHYCVDEDQQKAMQVVYKPHQKDFVSLIQWYGKEQVLPNTFDFLSLREGHRLVPYEKTIFGLYVQKGYSLFSDDGFLNTTFEGERHSLGVPLAIVKFNNEEYKHTLDKYNKFWEWRTNRNAKRLEMEQKFFYDGKHASHLVRLLKMAVEILRDGEVIVKRPDAEELLSIRNGAWSYEQIVAYAEQMDKQVREHWYKNTCLPKTPNINLAAQVLLEVQDMVWKTKTKNS